MRPLHGMPLIEDDESGKRFWFTVTGIVGILALLKGIRLPNRWAATQAQIDYSQGFVKRGFFGAVVSGPLHLFIYSRFAMVSYLLLGLLAVLLVVLAFKSGISKRLGGVELLALYFGSYSVTLLASTVGYMDIPLAIVVVMLLFIRDPMLRLGLSLPLTIVCLMVHEMFLIVFVPVLLLSFVLQGINEDSQSAKRWVLVSVLILGCVALLTTFKIALLPSMSASQAALMTHKIASRVDFEPRQDFYDVMTRSANANWQVMKATFQTPDWKKTEITSAILLGPTVVLLLTSIRHVLRNSVVSAKGWVFFLVAICACSPIAMHIYGWDYARWNGLVCLTSFLSLIVVVKFTKGASFPVSIKRQRLVTIVLLVSMASGGLLMEREDKFFPWYQQRVFRKQLQTMTLAQIANLSN